MTNPQAPHAAAQEGVARNPFQPVARVYPFSGAEPAVTPTSRATLYIGVGQKEVVSCAIVGGLEATPAQAFMLAACERLVRMEGRG